jgi:hypothetical protein
MGEQLANSVELRRLIAGTNCVREIKHEPSTMFSLVLKIV